ncbi:MAG: amidohydrolase [Thermodesulfobacteriota bacterium]|nr:amidohydrolase [Thermodesulfobacteriota bacterium]
MEITEQIEKYREELISLRRDFHQHPELGFEEHRTAKIIENYLKALGIATRRIAKTGVVGLLEGSHPGPVLMLRADMDALPIDEENDIDYKSQNKGVMHACGHDAHMAMLLIAAKILVEKKDDIAGTVKFVFQPNEEIAGAIHMVNDGVLENPKVDAVIGMHVWTPVESGKIAITPGSVMGGLDVFKVTIYGKGGHTGVPEDAVDPIIAAAGVIQTVQVIQTREISNLKSTIIMFGKITGGTKSNIIPDKVELEGSIRFLYQSGPDSEEQPTERFIRIVEQVCRTHRCECKIDITHENIPLINNEEMVILARQTALDVFADKEHIIDNQTIASEDFSEFSERVPGVFMFLGTGNEKIGTHLSHHHPQFNIDEETLPKGVEMFVRGALNFFEKSNRLTFIKRR